MEWLVSFYRLRWMTRIPLSLACRPSRRVFSLTNNIFTHPTSFPYKYQTNTSETTQTTKRNTQKWSQSNPIQNNQLWFQEVRILIGRWKIERRIARNLIGLWKVRQRITRNLRGRWKIRRQTVWCCYQELGKTGEEAERVVFTDAKRVWKSSHRSNL